MHWSKNPRIRTKVIKKISLSKLGKPSPRKGVKLSRLTCKKISKAKLGKPLFAKRAKVDELKICKEYNKGESTLTLGKIYKISYETVNRILLRNGYKLRTHRDKVLNANLNGRSSNTKRQRLVVSKKWRGKKNPRWSGGWYVDKYNYKWIHDDKDRWRKEHRVVVERILGRDLERYETIHHINEDKQDNRPRNLYYFPNDSLHKRHHGLKNKPKLQSNLALIK